MEVHGAAVPELKKLKETGQSQQVSFIGLDEHRQKQRYTVMTVAIPGGYPGGIQLTQPLEPRAEFAQRMLIQSLSITTLLALVSGIVIYFFIHIKIRGPLGKLSRKAIEIGKGNLVPDLEIKGEDELVGLAKIMNDMCTRLRLPGKNSL
ncbi:MAG: HAMP domain-containing protein [Desulforhopalus sp.]